MRVNNISNNLYVYQEAKEKGRHEVPDIKGANYDIKISHKGAEYQYALRKVKEEETFRTDKVNEIKEKIQNNTYNVSARDIAEKMARDIFRAR